MGSWAALSWAIIADCPAVLLICIFTTSRYPNVKQLSWAINWGHPGRESQKTEQTDLLSVRAGPFVSMFFFRFGSCLLRIAFATTVSPARETMRYILADSSNLATKTGKEKDLLDTKTPGARYNVHKVKVCQCKSPVKAVPTIYVFRGSWLRMVTM